MAADLGPRIRALFAFGDHASMELVMTANALAAIAVAAIAWLKVQLAFGLAAALVPAVFVLLTGCLLSPYTVWISAVLGGLAMSIAPAFVVGALAEKIHPTGLSVGLVLGFLVGFVGA